MQKEVLHISKDCVLMNLKEDKKETIIHALSSQMEKLGYVKESFETAVLDREAQYPTGLKINKYNIAIPHTEPQHVLKPCIGIATLKQRVPFHRMDSCEENVDVDVVLLLALNQGHTHMEVLSRIIEMCQNEQVIDTLMKSRNEQEIVDIVKKRLSGGESL